MDPRIRQLRSTTFGGERLTRRQIAAIQETVGTFPKLSRTELGHTICVHLGWQTPTGRNRIQQAQGLLEELERLGILTLPARQGRGRGPQKLVETGAGSDPQPAIAGPLAELRPLELAVASGRGGGRRVERMGAALSPARLPPADRQPRAVLALRDRRGRQLGCLLFDFAARQVACRDRWIGWEEGAYRKYLRLVVRNARYLLLPWVRVKNLASHALGLAARQLPGDWERLHGYRPVLCESYVDSTQYAGTCYRAANWQRIGETAGRTKDGPAKAKPPKQVWVYPLQRDWQPILRHGRAVAKR